MGVKDTANLAMIPAAYAEEKVYSVLPSDGDGDFTFTRSGSGTRINKGGYIETMGTNVPRLNYDLTNGTPSGCPSLLLEPSRSNKLGYSQDFTNWGDTGVTVTSNAAIAPDGTQTADKLVSTTNNWRRNKSFTAVNGFTYTFSVFVKLDTSTTTTTTQIEIYKGATGIAVDFDLENQTISGSGFSDPFIEKYPNGWFRIGGTYQANGTTNIVYVYPSSGYGVGGTMFFWGAQAEVGFQKTSYIHTPSSSQVTRTVDWAKKTSGLENILNTSVGTLFFDLTVSSTDLMRISISDSSSGNDYILLDLNGGNFKPTVRSDSGYFNPTLKAATVGERIKIAFTYSSNQIKMTYDGNTPTTTSITYAPIDTFDRFNFSLFTGSFHNWQGKIYQAMYFSKALTDAEMVEITTP